MFAVVCMMSRCGGFLGMLCFFGVFVRSVFSSLRLCLHVVLLFVQPNTETKPSPLVILFVVIVPAVAVAVAVVDIVCCVLLFVLCVVSGVSSVTADFRELKELYGMTENIRSTFMRYPNQISPLPPLVLIFCPPKTLFFFPNQSPREMSPLPLLMQFVVAVVHVAADFRELKELYGMTEPNFPHRDEGIKSDYYDPLVHGARESNRQ